MLQHAKAPELGRKDTTVLRAELLNGTVINAGDVAVTDAGDGSASASATYARPQDRTGSSQEGTSALEDTPETTPAGESMGLVEPGGTSIIHEYFTEAEKEAAAVGLMVS